jgi:DNA-binding transcriptional ArsR family regulator
MIGDPTRAAMLGALLGGEALPAGELARRAGIAPATATSHLARLVEHGLLVPRRAGCHRYYAASADVAAALEALGRITSSAARRSDEPAPNGSIRFRARYDTRWRPWPMVERLDRQLIVGAPRMRPPAGAACSAVRRRWRCAASIEARRRDPALTDRAAGSLQECGRRSRP